MPKLGMRPVRRRQLVDATIASINKYGLAAATVNRIAETAGVRPGIVHHYFADKDELLFETMRQLLKVLREETVSRLRASEGTVARLHAIVDASFAQSQSDAEVKTAWLALYASARQSEPLARILGLYHRRLHSNLCHEFRKLFPSEEAEREARILAALIDGMWLRYALGTQRDENNMPLQLVQAHLDRVLSTSQEPEAK